MIKYIFGASFKQFSLSFPDVNKNKGVAETAPLLYNSVSEKHEIPPLECYLTISPKVTLLGNVCCLIFKPQDYAGWPALWKTPEKLQIVLKKPFKVLQFWFDKAVNHLSLVSFPDLAPCWHWLMSHSYNSRCVAENAIRGKSWQSSCSVSDRPDLGIVELELSSLFGSGIAMSSWTWTSNTLKTWKKLWHRSVSKWQA